MYTLSKMPGQFDHTAGPLSAPVILVEYGDFECPHSQKAFHWITGFRKEFGNDLCYIFRHYPLSEIHPHAALAAAACEAASMKGKFWEMHNLLFTRRELLSLQMILKMAKLLDLNEEEFLSNLNSKNVLDRIAMDIQSGEDSGVISTPAFFYNGMRLEGPISQMILRENIIKTLGGHILTA